MRVGVIQSCYLPWRGFFDFVASVDKFIFLDDIQYTRRDWRNRNQLKTKNGLVWISVPVKYGARGTQAIDQTQVDYSGVEDWRVRHLNLLQQHYANAPHYAAARSLLEAAFAFQDRTISELNIRLVRSVCDYLGIRTELAESRALHAEGAKTDRLIDILRKVGATRYLSGASADAYLDKPAFAANGIALEYKSYDYPAYPQLWGEFAGAVSILDLIANCGPASSGFVSSQSPDRIIVPEAMQLPAKQR